MNNNPYKIVGIETGRFCGRENIKEVKKGDSRYTSCPNKILIQVDFASIAGQLDMQISKHLMLETVLNTAALTTEPKSPPLKGIKG